MAFPTTTVLDDFNRATLGANWSTFGPAGQPLDIASSTVLARSVSGYCGSYWNVSTPGPDCEHYATVSSSPPSNQYFGLMARVSTPATAIPDGYKAGWSANALTLNRVDDAVDTQIGASYSWTPSSGHKVGLEVIGSTVTAYTDQGSGWTQRISTTDSVYSGAGNLAIDLFDDATLDVQLDDFGGGTVAAASAAAVMGRTFQAIPFMR